MSDAELYFLTENAFSRQMLAEPALALMVLRVMAEEGWRARSALSSEVTLRTQLSLN
jgi:hypothetical protein